jgi:SPP1 gp7 family putative phage head morphogenesis protein
MAGTPEGQGLIARVTTALRYAFTGESPLGWFGPLNPLPAQAPEEVRGRQFDFPVGANLNYKPRNTEPLNFDQLKKLARHPIVAMLIQRQKDLVSAQDWQIKPRLANEDDKIDDPAVQTLTDFFRFPDQEHDWCQWIGAVLDQMLVIDAVSVYNYPTRNGGVYALQLLDGATIKPLINLSGRRPLPPDAAYQQILKGLPAIDYTTDELIYFPQVYRADRFYGYSRVEQAADLVNMAISRLKSQQGYFDFGNVGDGYFSAPDDWTPDQILGLEAKWNSYMQSTNPGVRHAPPFVPAGTEWHPTKVDVLADEFDEFIIRLLCFPFGVAPTPFMKQMGLGQGSAKTDHEAAEEGGIAPMLQYVERLMSLIIAKWFGRPDLEFSFVDNREFDPKTAAEIDDINLKNGSATINEVRDRRGVKPLTNGDVPLLSSGWTRLEDAVKEPEPVPTALGGAGLPGAPGAPGARENKTPPAKGEDGGEATDEEADLSKAADPAVTRQFAIHLATYLETKGAAIADDLAAALTKAADQDRESIDAALNGIDWSWDDIPDLVEPFIAGIAAAAGQNAVSELGIFDADILARVSANATAYAQGRAAEFVGMKLVDGKLVDNPNPEWSITGATREMLRVTLTAAMSEGLSNQELATRIRESTAFSKSRAMSVARTETAKADVQGSISGWKESGVVGGKKFLAAPECCDHCQTLNGKIVGLDEEFEEGDPPVHPNCRCDVVAVLPEDMPGA